MGWASNLRPLDYESDALPIANPTFLSVASPNIWNFLLPGLHSCKCPDTFKTHYFQQTFSSFRYVPPRSQIRHLMTLCAFINFIYLFTYLLNKPQWPLNVDIPLLTTAESVGTISVLAVRHCGKLLLLWVENDCLGIFARQFWGSVKSIHLTDSN